MIIEESSENGSHLSRRGIQIADEYPTQVVEDTNMNLITHYSEQEQRQINRFLMDENTMEESQQAEDDSQEM